MAMNGEALLDNIRRDGRFLIGRRSDVLSAVRSA